MKPRALGAILLAAASLQCVAPLRAPQPPASVRLYVFDCGKLDAKLRAALGHAHDQESE